MRGLDDLLGGTTTGGHSGAESEGQRRRRTATKALLEPAMFYCPLGSKLGAIRHARSILGI